jgi:hypothetical protein
MLRLPLLHAYWRAAARVLRRHQWHRVPRAVGLKSPPASSLASPTPRTPPLRPLTVASHRITMGKKKNDFEPSDNGTKKAERTHRVPLTINVVWLMYTNWTPCAGWRDMHLPSGGWPLSYLWVPVWPVPPREPERSAEIRRRRRQVPAAGPSRQSRLRHRL